MPAKDSLTITLEGEVTLRAFTDTLASLQELITEISQEVARAADIRWVITGLEYGSTTATMRGIERNANQSPVTRVIEAYEEVGDSLQMNRPPPTRLGAAVALRVADFKRVVTYHVADVRMETEDFDAILKIDHLSPVVPIGELTRFVEKPSWSYGSVRGRVQAASSRGQLRFTLYESLNDRAVSCYLGEHQDALITENWGRSVYVSGRVTRDPDTGRPLAIRRITEIVTVPEFPPGSWRAAKGAYGWRDGDPLAETVIRESRDA
jgi:hypothetical protein